MLHYLTIFLNWPLTLGCVYYNVVRRELSRGIEIVLRLAIYFCTLDRKAKRRKRHASCGCTVVLGSVIFDAIFFRKKGHTTKMHAEDNSCGESLSNRAVDRHQHFSRSVRRVAAVAHKGKPIGPPPDGSELSTSVALYLNWTPVRFPGVQIYPSSDTSPCREPRPAETTSTDSQLVSRPPFPLPSAAWNRIRRPLFC